MPTVSSLSVFWSRSGRMPFARGTNSPSAGGESEGSVWPGIG